MRNLFIPFCVLTAIFPLAGMSEGYHEEYKNVLAQTVVDAEQAMDKYLGEGGAPGLYFDVTALEGLLATSFALSGDSGIKLTSHVSLDESGGAKVDVKVVSDESNSVKRAQDMLDHLATKNDGLIYHQDLYMICKYAIFGQINIQLPQHLIEAELIPCYKRFVNILVDLNAAMSVTYENIHGSDLTRFNQECTPPISYKDNKAVTDLYCLSDKYSHDPAFQKAWITQLRVEAPVCEDVKDGAGMTCFGVAEKHYPEMMTKQPDFTIPDAEDIAYKKYYKNYKFNELPDALRGDFFSIAWNQGSGNAQKVMKKLQQIVGLPEEEINGYYGEKTKQAILNYKGPDLRQQIIAARWLLHQASRNADKFLDGWAVQDIVVMENGCHSQNKNNAPLLIKPKTQPAACLTTRNSSLGLSSPSLGYFSQYANKFK